MEIMGKGKNGVGFGKVDVTVEKELRKEFDIQKTPELKLFFEGNRSEPISCKGNGCLCVSQSNASCGNTYKRQHFSGLTELQVQFLLVQDAVGSHRVEMAGSAPRSLSRT